MRGLGRLVLLALPLLILAQQAMAAGVEGNGALALSELVGANSPALSNDDKAVLAALFDGHVDGPFPAHEKIVVKAGSITCKASDVDIAHHVCTLAFGSRTSALAGRAAHELFATLIEVGVRPEGAAGTIYTGLSRLDCTIDPAEIARRDGGGATCSFDTVAGK